jgi:hypothetical protein
MGQGIEQAHDTGYGGSGFKLNEQDDEAWRIEKRLRQEKKDTVKRSQIQILMTWRHKPLPMLK